jgi:site-specific recombinase XerD
MLALLDVRFTFLCRTGHQNEKGKSPIVLRIVFRGERRDVFTGLYCCKTNWQGSDVRVAKTEKAASTINQNLELIYRKAMNCFDEFRFSGSPFSIDELIDKLKGRENKPTLLIDYLEEGNQKMLRRVGNEIRKPTYYKYRRSLAYMQEFLFKEYKVKNFILQRVSTGFLEGYYQFLRNDKNISHNSACKYIGFVRTILSPAIREGFIKPDPFMGLKIRLKPVFREYLTQEEIDRLVKLELTDPDLKRKRDVFLFACYTGLAYVDIRQLAAIHLELNNTGSWHIRKPRQKTGQESIIPLLPAARRILEKYSLTKDLRDFRWYISSNQKMNEGLKHIGRKAGISKTLYMHLARHTFATTVTLQNGIPIETVSKMLGHASVKQTEHYAKVVASKIKSDMDKIMGLYQ